MLAITSLWLALASTSAAQSAPAEDLRGVTVTQGTAVTDEGLRVRTYLSTPTGASHPLPAVPFVQWLSCDPVTLRPGRRGGWALMLRGLIEQSGLVVMRTEKPGLGGSEGPACAQLDYQTELAAPRRVAGPAGLARRGGRQRVRVRREHGRDDGPAAGACRSWWSMANTTG